MKDTLLLLAIVLATFIVMFCTSLLFSWSWVMAHWSRQVMVSALLLVELFHGILVYKTFGKKLMQKNQ